MSSPAPPDTSTDERDPVAELADDVAAETEDYPEGCPELRPVLALPRMRRADAYEALGRISAYQREVKAANGESLEQSAQDGDDEEGETPEPVELDPLSYGAQYRVIAYIEEYLAVVAVNEKAFRAWAAKASDPVLVKAFNVYLRKTQPGEAESSTG